MKKPDRLERANRPRIWCCDVETARVLVSMYADQGMRLARSRTMGHLAGFTPGPGHVFVTSAAGSLNPLPNRRNVEPMRAKIARAA